MLNRLEHCYLQQPEPIQGCFLAIRDHILRYDPDITEALKYGMPFFCYRGKMMWYLWVRQKTQQPYLGVVMGNKIDHPQLVPGNRIRMKILLLDPAADLPRDTLDFVLQESIDLYPQ